MWAEKLPTLNLWKIFEMTVWGTVVCCIWTQNNSYTSKIAPSLPSSCHSALTHNVIMKVPFFFFYRHTNTCVPLLFFKVHWGQKQCGACVSVQEHVPPSDLESSWQHHQTFMKEMERLWRTVWTQGYRKERQKCGLTKVNGTYLH